MTLPLTDHRCSCGRLLFKGELRTAWIEIKCRRCGELAHFSPRYVMRKTEVAVSATGDEYATTTVMAGAFVFRDGGDTELEAHALWMEVDELWHCVKASDGLIAFTASTPEMLMGRKLFELLAPERAIASSSGLIQATAVRAPFVLERIAFAELPDRLVRMHGIPHFRENGECSGYTLVFEG